MSLCCSPLSSVQEGEADPTLSDGNRGDPVSTRLRSPSFPVFPWSTSESGFSEEGAGETGCVSPFHLLLPLTILSACLTPSPLPPLGSSGSSHLQCPLSPPSGLFKLGCPQRLASYPTSPTRLLLTSAALVLLRRSCDS